MEGKETLIRYFEEYRINVTKTPLPKISLFTVTGAFSTHRTNSIRHRGCLKSFKVWAEKAKAGYRSL